MSRFFWLDGLDRDLREHVLFSLRVLWTQASNALEGKTFSKGDTLFFLREGLTVSGKTLQEHLDIKGHSDAVERMAEMTAGGAPPRRAGAFRAAPPRPDSHGHRRIPPRWSLEAGEQRNPD
ncbi:MAG: hypothetical protein IK061_02575 [Desulfovibrio sp.]|nr:hypothetical protein [Desulfovibrio sp.]